MAWHDRIEQRPDLLGGQPTVRGARIPVSLIVDRFAHGATEAEVIAEFRQLTPDDVRAALACAADRVAVMPPAAPAPSAPATAAGDSRALAEAIRSALAPFTFLGWVTIFGGGVALLFLFISAFAR